MTRCIASRWWQRRNTIHFWVWGDGIPQFLPGNLREKCGWDGVPTDGRRSGMLRGIPHVAEAHAGDNGNNGDRLRATGDQSRLQCGTKESEPFPKRTKCPISASAIALQIQVIQHGEGQSTCDELGLQSGWQICHLQLEQWLGMVLRSCGAPADNVAGTIEGWTIHPYYLDDPMPSTFGSIWHNYVGTRLPNNDQFLSGNNGLCCKGAWRTTWASQPQGMNHEQPRQCWRWRRQGQWQGWDKEEKGWQLRWMSTMHSAMMMEQCSTICQWDPRHQQYCTTSRTMKMYCNRWRAGTMHEPFLYKWQFRLQKFREQNNGCGVILLSQFDFNNCFCFPECLKQLRSQQSEGRCYKTCVYTIYVIPGVHNCVQCWSLQGPWVKLRLWQLPRVQKVLSDIQYNVYKSSWFLQDR